MGSPIVNSNLFNFQLVNEPPAYFNVSYIRETVEKYGLEDANEGDMDGSRSDK